MSDTQTEENISKSLNPLVFISHDTRDGELAEAFSNLLKSVSAGVLKTFRTSDRKGNQGIEYGVEWYPEIIKNIQGASDVVCLLTKRSVDRPWILFEAGMAKGKLDTPILGVALGIELKDASSGPFAQFQNCGDDEDSLTKLVFQLVKRIPNSEPDKDTIKFQVGKFKQSISAILEKLDTSAKKDGGTKPSADTRDIENSSAKLFEEIKIMFQDLPSRIERADPIDSRKRRRRIHPGMIEEMIHTTKDGKLGIRIALSFYREKMPWVYDEGILLLNKIEGSKTPTTIKHHIHEFEELLIVSTRHPIMEEFFMEDKEDYFLLMELPKVILRSLEKIAFEHV
ncbi:hypothetical protein W03_06090 [Nitrosomonas sp. PY1]|uniref:toll/interleukin-1 receptor domain-containing protein n=1 Tax=Nitrosomonas sp. PY1 TaxID=1803906 RepID=UPI001FC7D88A|nr:toll/interleukin-1 receptor domain-containing protein [Nitrosomonas sp. PY1]GKS68605.1 hypothetical protein W03_06090 [Nitrosomonas sp. PY1]